MAFLKGFGACVPSRAVRNEEMAALTGATAEWILNVSGIEERRYASEETVADLATTAASRCLERCGLGAESLGMIIVASGTPERQFPGPALTVASRLGLAAPPERQFPGPALTVAS